MYIIHWILIKENRLYLGESAGMITRKWVSIVANIIAIAGALGVLLWPGPQIDARFRLVAGFCLAVLLIVLAFLIDWLRVRLIIPLLERVIGVGRCRPSAEGNQLLDDAVQGVHDLRDQILRADVRPLPASHKDLLEKAVGTNEYICKHAGVTMMAATAVRVGKIKDIRNFVEWLKSVLILHYIELDREQEPEKDVGQHLRYLSSTLSIVRTYVSTLRFRIDWAALPTVLSLRKRFDQIVIDLKGLLQEMQQDGKGASQNVAESVQETALLTDKLIERISALGQELDTAERDDMNAYRGELEKLSSWHFCRPASMSQ